MSKNLIRCPAGQAFAGFPASSDLVQEDVDVAIVGVPFITTIPDPGRDTSVEEADAVSSKRVDARNAPRAIRRWSQPQFANLQGHYDFDLGNEVLAGREVSVLDCGDVVMKSDDATNIRRATETIRTLISKGAVPIVIGGDHATTIPVLRAFEGYESICAVQVDAHLDWLDQRNGVYDGFSSPMRRASEMSWVTSMIQIGLRGLGSAKREELEAALAYGSVLVMAEEMHDRGMEQLLDKVPEAEHYYITIDIDGLDPSIAPGTKWPAPGGLTYYQIIKLFRGLAEKGKVVGLDLVGVVPELDFNDLTSGLVARIFLSFIGILTASGQFD